MVQDLKASYQLNNSINDIQPGHLKIFCGYAAGVGKTYSMLQAAHSAKEQGVDVIIGYIEQHTRPDTLKLMDGLESLSPIEITYRGLSLKEFDLDGALNRKPQLILVDELAHSNAEGSRHTKRYQDVEELLRAGIDVYTTMNIQHLESLKDVVDTVTNVAVNERIPDSVFDAADQIELIDIEPDDLILRLKMGKIYKKEQASRALNHFFSRDNLRALRELAMRRTADHLSRHAQKQGNPLSNIASDHILVCISSSPSNAKVIRTAARMAEAFHSHFTALYVEDSDHKPLKAEELKQLRNNLRLAEQLGAQISTVYGDDPAFQIAEYVKVSGITKIVLGRNNKSGRIFTRHKTLTDKLNKLVDNIDIYIIPDDQPRQRQSFKLFSNTKQEFSWKDFVKVIGLNIIATLISFGFYQVGLREANIITVYILAVLLTAVWTRGHWYGVLASLFSVISFNYFFTVPRFTLEAYAPDYPVTFLIMLVASVLSSSLATRVKKQAQQSAQRAYHMEIIMNSNQKLADGQHEFEIIQIAASQIAELINRPILYALTQNESTLQFSETNQPGLGKIIGPLNQDELAIANWVIKNNKHAGATTNTLSHAQNLYMAVRGSQEALGIIGIPIKYYPVLSVFEKNLIVSILNDCGLMLERRHLIEEKQAIEIETQRERLRSNLLRSISHDLRTPLTSISGNASVLMDQTLQLEEKKKQNLYSSIYDDAMWLINLTENLLSITKLDNGTMNITLNAELIEDVVHEAITHIDRNISDHHFSVKLTDELLVAKMDARLIVQVLVNLINNAIKYTQSGSSIILSAKKVDNLVQIELADDGPGISDQAKIHLFDMFYTADLGQSDSRRGLGLGLSLCKSIIEAHGGEIGVEDNQPNGTIFSFTLPLEEVHIKND
ncbi:sensor histidine kinase [Facklamia miroungae]|uniref:histidine kinase n=1 Tax=Facklamia miroungae TaxID=120956 RepID=A0A1G7SSY9_9LACT|nr:sensor histidine kinase KdpD [Facklamia miroungae]NKZ29567.1 sensor histidine kinase KdpD [Facklamia miroungae]SDG25559.1 two-component system, OmpR family, sensor histidine kinase KdpD [Facklamia miroungae]